MPATLRQNDQLHFSSLPIAPNGAAGTHARRRTRRLHCDDALLSPTQSARPANPPQWADDSPYGRIKPEWMSRWAPSPASVDAVRFRHSFWQTDRERIRRCLVDAGMPLARRYSFQECGGQAMVWVDKSRGLSKCTCYCCHDRWCEACGRQRRQKLAIAIAQVLPGRRAVHIVLTPKSSDRPLRDQARKLIRDYTKLRRRKWWQARAEGGAWTFELTWNNDTHQWHPHLHTIVHTSWMQLQELSAEWLAVTGDSHRVHISLVHDQASAVREVSKYVGKLVHRSWSQSPALIVCAMKALSGLKLCGTFGTWRGVELAPVAKPDPEADWQCWGSLDRLYELAKERDPEALEILAQLHGKPASPAAKDLNPRPPPARPQADPS